VLAATLLTIINPLAGYFLAVHTFAVKYTSVGYLEAVPSFTSLLCILAFERWNRLYRSRTPRFLFMKVQAAHLWLAVSAVTLGLSAASKYIYAVAGIAIVVYALWRAFLERRSIQAAIIPLLGWGILALLVFYAADPFIWLDPIGQLKLSIFSNMNFSSSDFVRSLGYPLWQPFIWLSKPVTAHNTWAIPNLLHDFLVILDLPINLLALVGVPRTFKRYPLYGVWMIIGLIFLLVWGSKWPQYILVILAPLCLSAAQGVITLLLPGVWLGKWVMKRCAPELD
jgi:hypothetical protein